MDTLVQDVRYALRTLAKAKAFTAIAVVCLALGIAANVTVFTPVNTLLLRPLPFADPDRVMAVHMTQLSGSRFEGSWSYLDYRDLGNGAGAFESVAAFATRVGNLGGGSEPERVNGARMSASLFPLLGFTPVLGRQMRADEEVDGRVLLISHSLWHRRFGGSADVIGRAVTMNGEPHTIIGVMPEGIRFPEVADVWLPLRPAEGKDRREWRSYQVLGRLAAGVRAEEANVRVAGITRQLAERHPETNRDWGAWVEPYREVFARDVRPMMLILLGAVGFVLLIACANVANLLLARATSRQREIALRLALGASRRRIVRQLLTESVLLGVLGGALGLVLGMWGLDAILALVPVDELAFWMTFEVDRRVVLMTVGISLATGVVFGLAPALKASSPVLSETLKDSGRGATATLSTGRMRNTLVVSEIALSVVLLIGAALMVRSLLETTRANLGFDPRNVLAFETSLQGERYASDTARYALYQRMHERVAAIPGVDRVGAVFLLPIEGCCSWTPTFVDGKEYPNGEGRPALYNVATPGAFEALRVRLLAGRAFDERDVASAPPVIIVNRAFAEREWPGESALGKRLRFQPSTDSTRYTVVGVVDNVTQDNDLEDRDSRQVWRPFAQTGGRTLVTVIRARGDAAALAPAVRGAVAEVDRELPLARLRTMPEMIGKEMFEPRVYSTMFAIFAVAALLLATIGLYGVMSYAVAQRTHEIGVRMALGAQARDVLAMIVRHGAWMVGAGLLIGIPAALGLAQVLRGALYGVSPTDLLTFVAVPVVLASVAIVASYIPARRATRVDPVVALRND